MYDTIPHYALKFLRRKVYPKFFRTHELPPLECEQDLDKANQMIYDLLMGDKPCMIARVGATEMEVMSNYYQIQKGKQSVEKYIKGEGFEWWWNNRSIHQLEKWSGVFPANQEVARQFAELSISDLPQIDILGSWLNGEATFSSELKGAKKVQLFNLEPFFSMTPWTRALKGKKVLLVHPFVETIEKQYANRKKLFVNQDILPEFTLITYQSVQSLGGNDNYKDWFAALEKMECDIDAIDFDIAVLGCGAYGLSLAAHIKRSGRKAFHLGGATQLLFGIKGSRWENPVQQMCKNGYYPDLFNEYWVRPGEAEKPKTASKVEGGCYW